MSELSEEIKQKYDWIPNISITLMEFLHGALRRQNQNALFFIRSAESLFGIPDEFNNKFVETSESAKIHMKV